MKGYVYYSKGESVRNHAFIEDLIKEAKNRNRTTVTC